MGLRTWLRGWIGEDKLEKNLTTTQKTKILTSSLADPTGNEDETNGNTYDNIIEALRQTAITNESISMVANSFIKGVYGSKVSIQNTVENENTNIKVEKILKTLCEQKNLMLNEEHHLNAFLRAIVEAYIRDGGYIVRKHKISPSIAKQRKYELPYRIELLEITDIDFEKYDKEERIFNGIQLNAQKKPIKIFFKGGKEVPYSQLILHISKTRISQLNGVSKIYPSLKTILNQETHAKAEVDNAIEQSKVSDVYKAKIAETLKIERSGDFDADLASSGTDVKEIDSRRPDKDAKIIGIDEEYSRLDRGAYSSAFEALNDFANGRVASGVGITKDEYTNDLSKLTFHGGKVADIRNREIFDILRDDIDNKVLIPIFTEALQWCYITGYLKVNPTKENIKLEIIKKPRKSAQPDKDATTFDKNYKNGFMTLGDIVKEISGENLKDYLKRRESEELALIESQKRIEEKRQELLKLTQNEEQNI